MPCRINKRIRSAEQEKVVLQNLLSLAEFLLCFLEVEVNIQCLDEICHRVSILVAFLPDNPNEVLELLLVLVGVTVAVAVCDDGGGEIAQDPGAVCLDRVDVGGREEHLREGVFGGLIVEEGEQGPVNQPGAVV